MASIVRRDSGKYAVVYRILNEDGSYHQKWETFPDHQTARARKAEVEDQINKNVFIPPKNQTIAEYLEDFVDIYGKEKWGLSHYDSNRSLIKNYIVPSIGDVQMQKLTARMIDKFLQNLRKTPPVSTRNRKARTEYITEATVDKIYRLLHCAFNKAVQWEIIGKNPFDNAIRPTTEYKERDIWDVETIRRAFEFCKDEKLAIAMHLAFACSMRAGEILGLQWERVHISDKDIASDDAYIYIDRELERASLEALKALDEKDVYYVFKPLKPDTTTRRILKTPKTKKSVRKVWLPKTVALILRDWKHSQDEVKEYFGHEYDDFDLVIAQNNGQPVEVRLIEKAFNQLKKDANLPDVVFHSLRHSSATYKLKLSNGDMKAVQGDTGHSKMGTLVDIYVHPDENDRKRNAQTFEEDFYSASEPQNTSPTDDVASLLSQLQERPDVIDTLRSLLSTPPTANAPA